MGFRNPVSSVSDVDTGDPLSGAGAKLYETVDGNGFPYGILEFPDGIAGDVSPKVTGKADYNPRAGAQTLGGGLRLQGGSYNPNGAGLIPAPEIDLLVVQNGDGSFSPKAALLNAPRGVEPLQSCTPVVGPGPNAGGGVLGPGWINYDTTTWPALKLWKLADGRVHFQGMLRNVNGSPLTSGAVIIAASTLPAWALPTHSIPPLIVRASLSATPSGLARVDVDPVKFSLVETTIPNGEWISLVGTYRTDA